MPVSLKRRPNGTLILAARELGGRFLPSVYDTVCDALSALISQRAAENIVHEALRSASLSPERVTAPQMQELLRGAIFSRLQRIIPLAKARGEVKTLLRVLDGPQRVKPSLPPEVQEGLSALQAELLLLQELAHPGASRLQAGIEQLTRASDPVRALNALWDDLAVLQAEAGASRLNSPRRTAGDPAPVQPRLASAVVTRAAPVTQSPLVAREKPAVRPRPPMRAQVIPAPDVLEAMLSAVASEDGVRGVLACDRTGTLAAARVPEGSAERLAGVTAATALLLEVERPFTVVMNQFDNVVVFIAPVGDLLVSVVAEADVNVGRVLGLLRGLGEARGEKPAPREVGLSKEGL